VCQERVLSRHGHPTLKADPSSIDVVKRFADLFEIPTVEEGFGHVIKISNAFDCDDEINPFV
jgi:hypothetical protein